MVDARLAFAVAGISFASLAAAQTTAPGPRPGTGAGPQSGTAVTPPPAYSAVRYNEDYSYLRGASRRSDPWDSIKYIPLTDDGDIWLSLGGSVRYRYEFFNDVNFGAGAQDTDGFHLLRAMPHADLHVGPNLRFFAQGIFAYGTDRNGGERAGLDENDADFQQAFADLKLPLGDEWGSVTLRGGRQNLLFGAQRLISPLEWSNARRTFDGGRVTWATRSNTLDFFWVNPVVVDEGPLDSSGEDDLAGFYNTLSLPDLIPGAGTKLDLYALYLDRDSGTFLQGSGDEERYTVGARLFGNPKPFDFDVEAAYQFGDFDGGDISAWMVAAEVGYTLAEMDMTPRLFVGFDYASGDDDPLDDDIGTFNQLFPLGHAYFGYIDALGRQNVIDIHPGIELTLAREARFVKKMTLRAEYHWFWRASDEDGIYNAGGALISRNYGATDERFIGSEIDLLLNWQVDRHLAAYFGYSHFFTGDFIDESGASENIDFVYAAVQYTF